MNFKRHISSCKPKIAADHFECAECNKNFKHKKILTSHVKSHGKIYSCEECGKTFLEENSDENIEAAHALMNKRMSRSNYVVKGRVEI